MSASASTGPLLLAYVPIQEQAKAEFDNLRINSPGPGPLHRQTGAANAALHRVVVVRMRSHQPTFDYVRRRTAEGKGKREIIRCLKRFVAREIFGYLCRRPNVACPAQIAA